MHSVGAPISCAYFEWLFLANGWHYHYEIMQFMKQFLRWVAFLAIKNEKEFMKDKSTVLVTKSHNKAHITTSMTQSHFKALIYEKGLCTYLYHVRLCHEFVVWLGSLDFGFISTTSTIYSFALFHKCIILWESNNHSNCTLDICASDASATQLN